GQRIALGGDVTVVEAPVRVAELLVELEGDVHAALGVVDGVGAVFPAAPDGAGAERVGADAAEGVPVRDRELQPVAHGLAADLLVGIVVLEREEILGFGTFVLDLADAGEILSHGGSLCLLVIGTVNLVYFGHR